MNLSRCLLVLSVCLPVLLALPGNRAVWQFGVMISCTGNRSVLDYDDYGCWCGWGGEGTAVDELDRCCQAHDQCYSTALQHGSCRRFWDNPYTKTYRFQCDWRSKTVSCHRSNNACESFICECDRRAAMCFARSRYNEKYRRYFNAYCK